jgi:hypothetical protein
MLPFGWIVAFFVVLETSPTNVNPTEMENPQRV